MMLDPTNGLLIATLEVAVPMWMLQLRDRGGPTDTDYARARGFADVLAEKADVLQFGGKKGEAAELFNRLAESLAIMSFCPGGVTFGPSLWEANPSPHHAERATAIRTRYYPPPPPPPPPVAEAGRTLP